MLLVGNGRLITRDEAFPYAEDGAVALDGEVIKEVGALSELRAKYPDAEFVDARGGVIMPGLINVHTHIYSGLARGLAIGGFNIYWYGVIIAAGMLLAMLYAFRNAVDYGIDSDRLVDVVAIGTVMAIVCARIYYVAMAPFAYQSLWEMIDIRKGGIAIYGAVIGAFVFGALAAKWRKVPLLPLFDLVSLGFLIGQGIGRWGNFFNQEAFGTNTTLPWGMYSEGTEAYLKSVQVTLPAGVTVDPAAPVHPTFLYESIWCLVGFAVLASFYKKRRFNGQIFLGYIIWYGLGRAWIEGLRTDSLYIGSVRVSQLLAIISCIAAVAVLARQYHRIKVAKAFYVPETDENKGE